MTLGTDDMKTTGSQCLRIQLDIRTTAGHVGCDSDGTVLSGVCNDGSLELMELRIQDVVLDTATLQHTADQLGGIDVDGTDQNRCTGLVDTNRFIHDGLELFLLRLINRIIEVDTLYRLVGRDTDDIHVIDVTELLLLGLCGTGHAGLLIKLVKEVLEGDRREGLRLTLDVHMLLRLDRLMETIAVTTARHDTSGELVDDEYLIILDHVVLITVHQVVCTKCQDHAVLDLQILRIREVLDMEELLYLMNTLLCEVDGLLLLVDDEVTGLLDLLAEDRIELTELSGLLTTLKLTGQHIADLIELRGLSGLSGNDERCTCFIDQDGIDLIDDAVVKATEYLLVLINRHVITEVVETELVIRDIGDITVIGSLTLLGGHGVQYHTYA